MGNSDSTNTNKYIDHLYEYINEFASSRTQNFAHEAIKIINKLIKLLKNTKLQKLVLYELESSSARTTIITAFTFDETKELSRELTLSIANLLYEMIKRDDLNRENAFYKILFEKNIIERINNFVNSDHPESQKTAMNIIKVLSKNKITYK